MPKLHYLGTNGKLEIMSTSAGWFSMHGYAWNATDCGVLDADAPRRGGGGLVIPGEDGTLGLLLRPTLASYSLPFIVTGDVDPLGNKVGSIAARESQFDTTMKYLKAQITAIPGTDDGTRSARLTLRNGDVRYADIHCVQFTFVGNLASGYSRQFTFDIDIPKGAFT